MPAEPGLTAAIDLVVTDADTAIAFRSGDVPVLATPRLVALLEEAAVAAVAGHLAAGETTVGMKIEIDHVQPTAVGQNVRADATVESVKGRRIAFAVAAHDDRGLVAAGRITRVLVERDRFLDKCQ